MNPCVSPGWGEADSGAAARLAWEPDENKTNRQFQEFCVEMDELKSSDKWNWIWDDGTPQL